MGYQFVFVSASEEAFSAGFSEEDCLANDHLYDVDLGTNAPLSSNLPLKVVIECVALSELFSNSKGEICIVCDDGSYE